MPLTLWQRYEQENKRALEQYVEEQAPKKIPRAERPHGDHRRYLSGCRCTECKRANTEYSRKYSGATPRKPRTHGTTAKYGAGCRCAVCKTAQTKYRRDNAGKGHGRRSTYNLGCRCAECRRANADYWQQWNKKQKRKTRK